MQATWTRFTVRQMEALEREREYFRGKTVSQGRLWRDSYPSTYVPALAKTEKECQPGRASVLCLFERTIGGVLVTNGFADVTTG